MPVGTPAVHVAYAGASTDDPTVMHSRRIRDLITGRWFVKSVFLAFFVFSVVQLLRFAAWARGRDRSCRGPRRSRGILPIGHFTSFFAWVRGGGWDTLLPAGLVIILAAFAVSLLFKRGFCGWICPVGTVWEAFAALGRRSSDATSAAALVSTSPAAASATARRRSWSLPDGRVASTRPSASASCRTCGSRTSRSSV